MVHATGANETRQFARMLGLEPKNTAVRSPESNGIAESYVKTIKRDYISIMPKPDGLTAARTLRRGVPSIITNGIRAGALKVIAFRHGKIICSSGLVMG